MIYEIYLLIHKLKELLMVVVITYKIAKNLTALSACTYACDTGESEAVSGP